MEDTMVEVKEAAAKPEVKVPKTFEEADALMNDIREAQTHLRSKIGTEEDEIAQHYSEIARLNEEIKKKGGDILKKKQQARAEALGTYIHQNRFALLQGKLKGEIQFTNGKVVVDECPEAISPVKDEHTSAMEILAMGRQFWDGTFVTGTLNRKAIRDAWEQMFSNRLNHTWFGKNILVRILPHGKPLSKKDSERLEAKFTPDATE